MGVWGVGIYSNDTAAEVRDICNEIFPFVSVSEGNKIIFNEFHELLSSKAVDDDYASFWYALSDWQWKHGILNDSIRTKTLDLLKDYSGLDDWQKSSSKINIKKRKCVLDKLRLQLSSVQPAVNLPKARLAKPKHKAGDIIVFKTIEEGEDTFNCWVKDGGHTPFLYASSKIRESSMEFSHPVLANGKYLAVLCVGTKKQRHSQYIVNIYDENSVYVFYDYCNTQKPTIDSLRGSGFLPCIIHTYNREEKKVENIGWTYTFTTFSSFRAHSSYGVEMFEKMNFFEEHNRFVTLMDEKEYSNEPILCPDLYHAFSKFFEEKTRLLNLNIEIDNLLDSSKENPILLTELKE